MTIEYPLAAHPAQLPPGSSPSLKLLPATVKEARKTSILNGQAWKGPLSIEDYLRREEHLCQQALSKDGGFTAWVLVDGSRPESDRTVLAACETIRKRALLREPDGTVRDVVSHGIGSVFCREEYRGRGYAQRMILELRKTLESWQQLDGEKAAFNVLHSDIGKDFYAKLGWQPYPSAHVTLPPVKSRKSNLALPQTEPILDKDIDDLCKADEKNLRHYLHNIDPQDRKIRIAQAPDAAVMRWHHAREEFIAKSLGLDAPKIKGACVRLPNGNRVWAIWTRTFFEAEAENTLYILRLVVENAAPHFDVNGHNGDADAPSTTAIAACLDAAQKEAASWNMSRIDVWNPSPITLAAAKICEPGTSIENREVSSIPSLLWYGHIEGEGPEWICNEKYAWC